MATVNGNKAAKLASANVVSTVIGKAATATTNVGELTVAQVKLGKAIWAVWVKEQRYTELGIREKTATGLGTRSNMLAVASFGYESGNGRLLAQAVAAARGQAPKGGIDFPWLEKAGNMATITSSAAIREVTIDGKRVMRLMPIVKARAVKASKPKATGNGNSAVRIVKAADNAPDNGPADTL